MRDFSRRAGVSAIFALMSAICAISGAAWAVEPIELRCEYRRDPQGLDTVKPRLSWLLSQDPQARDERQTAYQIVVASSLDGLATDHGDRWDSGKVIADRQAQIEYAGSPLTSRMRCVWKVRVWDAQDKPSAWSRPASWSMGLLELSDWKAQWIGNDSAYAATATPAKFSLQDLKWIELPEGQARTDTYLRMAFDLPADRQVKRATLALYAYNECRALINGHDIGMAAHWEATARLDATPHLKAGQNVVGLVVSHSDPYNPAAIGRLVIEFTAGDDLVLPLDESWRAAQVKEAGWEQVGFNADKWVAAKAIDGQPWKDKGPPPTADLARMPVPYLRHEFAVAKAIKRATAYVTALGTYELRINGQRVSEDVLAPGWTEFKKRVHYQTYDVTGMISQGQNAVAAILGDGWYASTLAHLGKRNIYGGNPRLLVQVELELADGSVQTVTSDETWKSTFGPLRHADLLMGCEYDARLVVPGWDLAGYQDAKWTPVLAEAKDKGIRIQATVAEPSRRIEELPALKVVENKPGIWTFDLGQNMVGWVRLKVKGSAGRRLTIRHAEMVNPDGTVYTAALRSCQATDYYICSGTGVEVFEPFGTFHGFRYVEIRGLEQKPELDAVTGIVVHTPLTRTGTFECSSAPLNQLYRNIIWGQKGNHLEIPTDCPQRDERMGWTGDTQFFAPTGSYNFDVAAFFTRWLQTCEDDQLPAGFYPHVVPDIMGIGGATAWGDATLLCTYNVYRVYGDTRIIAERFASMTKYMEWLATKTENGISKVGGFGDWLNAGGGAPKDLMDTAYHAHLARIMAEMATAIGRDADAKRYAALHEEVKAAFVQKFLADDGSLRDASQTGYALAFTMNLLPDAKKAQAAQKFVGEIERFDWHLATGFIGTPRLLPALSDAGRNDVAYRLLLTDTYPSWLFSVKNGATTMWERWNGWTPEAGFGDIKMNSYNHYAFGAVGEYLYGSVAGIQATSPGYKTIAIKPVIGDGVTWAKASFTSMHGQIESSWARDNGALRLAVVIPPNTTAVIDIPHAAGAAVTEGGKSLAQAAGIRVERSEPGKTVCAVGSGRYQFVTTY